MAAVATQAPAVPDPSVLSGLDPAVAMVFLGVVALGMLLFYFGPALRDRVARKTDAKPDPAAAAAVPLVLPSPVGLVDRTTEVTNQLLDAYKERIADLLSERREQDAENDELRRDLRGVQAENDRLRGDLQALRVEYERLRADQWRRP